MKKRKEEKKMIESLKKTRADYQRACYRHDAETLEAGADELAEFANKNTTRIMVAKPARKEADSDD